MTDLMNKWVVVTGAGSGIGLEVANKYSAIGYNVIGIDKHFNNNNLTFEKYECDVSDENALKSTFNTIKLKTDSVNYLINCSGIFFDEKNDYIENLKFKEWKAVIANNLDGFFLTTRECLPLLKKSTGDKAILNISSDQSCYPKQKCGAYAASKAGIDNFTKTCSIEFMKYKIRVNSVNPASVKTNFINRLLKNEEEKTTLFEKENQKMPFGVIEATDIANIVFFICSDQCKNITGQSLFIDSGKYNNVY